jgi:hypothetical protein
MRRTGRRARRDDDLAALLGELLALCSVHLRPRRIHGAGARRRHDPRARVEARGTEARLDAVSVALARRVRCDRGGDFLSRGVGEIAARRRAGRDDRRRIRSTRHDCGCGDEQAEDSHGRRTRAASSPYSSPAVNAITGAMSVVPQAMATRRSRPMAFPPLSGIPRSSASRKRSSMG